MIGVSEEVIQLCTVHQKKTRERELTRRSEEEREERKVADGSQKEEQAGETQVRESDQTERAISMLKRYTDKITIQSCKSVKCDEC